MNRQQNDADQGDEDQVEGGADHGAGEEAAHPAKVVEAAGEVADGAAVKEFQGQAEEVAHHLAAEVGVDAVGEVDDQVVLQQGQHRLDHHDQAHQQADRPEQAEIAGADHHINDLEDRQHEADLQQLGGEAGEKDQPHLGAVGADDAPEPLEIEAADAGVALGGFRWPHQHQLEAVGAELLQRRCAQLDDALAGVGQGEAAGAGLFHKKEAILEPDQGRRLQAVQLASRGGEGPHLEAEAFEDLTEMQQGNAAEAALTIEQHLLDRVAGEGEAVAAGQAPEADQGGVEGGVAPFAQGR